MDILSLLEEIQQESFVPKHPLSQSDISLRYAYAVGLGLTAVADGPLNETEQQRMEQLARGIGLADDQIERLFATVSQPDKSVVKTVIDSLTAGQEKYLFLLDAEILADADGESSEKGKKVLQAFCEMLRLDMKGKRLLENLSAAYYSEDWLLLQALLDKFGCDNKSWVYQALVYYLPQQSERRAAELAEAIADCSRIPADRPQPRRYIAGKSAGQRIYEDRDLEVAALIAEQEERKQMGLISSQTEAKDRNAANLGIFRAISHIAATKMATANTPFEIGLDDHQGESWDLALAKKKQLEEQLALLTAALADRYIS